MERGLPGFDEYKLAERDGRLAWMLRSDNGPALRLAFNDGGHLRVSIEAQAVSFLHSKHVGDEPSLSLHWTRLLTTTSTVLGILLPDFTTTLPSLEDANAALDAFKALVAKPAPTTLRGTFEDFDRLMHLIANARVANIDLSFATEHTTPQCFTPIQAVKDAINWFRPAAMTASAGAALETVSGRRDPAVKFYRPDHALTAHERLELVDRLLAFYTNAQDHLYLNEEVTEHRIRDACG